MRLSKIRFSVRGMLLTIAILAGSFQFVVRPAWEYYRLSPETRQILGKTRMSFALNLGGPKPLTLSDLLKQLKAGSITGPKDIGIPIYVDPIGLHEADVMMSIEVEALAGSMPVKDHLERALRPHGLDYFIKDGLLTITSAEEAHFALQNAPDTARHP